MSTFYKEIKHSTYWPHKGFCAFYTTPEFVNEIPKLLKEFDEFEYKYLPNDNFVFGYLVEKGTGEYIINQWVEPKYYGKFDLDINKFCEFCNERGIPIYIDVKQ